MMHRQKVKLLSWFVTLLSVLALVVAPALADGFTLTVEKAGAGTGTVTSDDGEINCGAVCEATYGVTDSGKLMTDNNHAVVTLTATPDGGSVFTRWGEDCGCTGNPRSRVGFDPGTGPCNVPMGEDRTCTANFGLPVGGIAVPVNKLGLLAPWMGLAALASFAALTVELVRRRKG